MIGKTIGKYRFVEELKRGGLGTVYKAIDETLEREVAIKVLNPELNDSELMKHFQAEATTLARLHHSDIATIHEFQRADSDLLMVTELVHGETLEQLADRCGRCRRSGPRIWWPRCSAPSNMRTAPASFTAISSPQASW